MVDPKYARQRAYRERRQQLLNVRLCEADRMEIALREIAFWTSESKKEMGIRLRAIAGAVLGSLSEPLDWEPPKNIQPKGEQA